jgi:hypothetical protein
MTGVDDLQLPRDPGPVPVSLRDAFARMRESERGAVRSGLPDEAAIDQIADAGDADEEARLATIEQLLDSADGAQILAHLVAAKVSTTGVDLRPGPGMTARESMDTTPLHLRGVRSRRRTASGLKPLLLAASLMLVAGTSWYVLTQPGAGDEVRTSGSVVELEGVQPGGTRTPITLKWRALRADARYTVEVLDSSDAPVFTVETNQTRAAVPIGTLKPGTYRWFVRAKSTDRTEIRSRVETFIVRE